MHDAHTDRMVSITRRLDRLPVTWFDLPSQLASEPVSIGGDLWYPYHDVLHRSPFEEPFTDADAFGLMRITMSGPPYDMKMNPLPLVFQIQESGVRGAKRTLQVRGISGEEIFVSIGTPCTIETGFGEENHLYSFHIRTSTWSRWVMGPGNGRLERTTLAAGTLPDEFTDEDSENAVSSEKMIIVFELDGKPRLHLDASEDEDTNPLLSEALREEQGQRRVWSLEDLDTVEFRDWMTNVEWSAKGARWRLFETRTTAYEIQDPKDYLKFASDRLRTLGIGSVRSLGSYRVRSGQRSRLAVFIRAARGSSGHESTRVLDSLLLVDE